jgi:hypothetical protein
MDSGFLAALGPGMTSKKTFFSRLGDTKRIHSPKSSTPNKILLFLIAALTIHRAMAKSIIRSCLVGSRDLQWFLLESGSLRREKTLKRHEVSSWAPQPWRWTNDA